MDSWYNSKVNPYSKFNEVENQMNYKLLFWNILCDEYSYDWKTAPNIELKYKVWEYRLKLFNQIFSIKGNISDLYCFVEVDKQDDIYLMLNNIIGQKIYEPVYFPRPNTPLGIMLVYNRYKFTLINSYRYLLGNNVKQNFALVTLLQEMFSPFNTFCLIITHLTAWDKNEHIRVKQVNNLFDNIKKDNNLKNLKISKFILCGDFNTGPESECVKIMIENGFKSVFEEEEKDINKFTMVIDTMDEGMKKLKFDYIFISGNINIVNKFMPIDYLNFEKGMPNENFPSDHIFLQTEFNLNK